MLHFLGLATKSFPQILPDMKIEPIHEVKDATSRCEYVIYKTHRLTRVSRFMFRTITLYSTNKRECLSCEIIKEPWIPCHTVHRVIILSIVTKSFIAVLRL